MNQTVPNYDDVCGEIGKKGWNALSWALHNGWVRDYKWYFSEMAGRDLGTPNTVQFMLQLSGVMKKEGAFIMVGDEPERAEYAKVGTRGLFKIADSLEPKHSLQFYRRLVEGYLLGTDFFNPLESRLLEDADGANPLEGELRRHWAARCGVKPHEVELMTAVIDDYCRTYGLDSAARFADRLRV